VRSYPEWQRDTARRSPTTSGAVRRTTRCQFRQSNLRDKGSVTNRPRARWGDFVAPDEIPPLDDLIISYVIRDDEDEYVDGAGHREPPLLRGGARPPTENDLRAAIRNAIDEWELF
jgi:hypothetical protein